MGDKEKKNPTKSLRRFLEALNKTSEAKFVHTHCFWMPQMRTIPPGCRIVREVEKEVEDGTWRDYISTQHPG